MKGKILKKILASALVMALVTGGIPVAPVADMFRDAVITANAEGSESVYNRFTAYNGTKAGTQNNVKIRINEDEGYNKLFDGIKTDSSNKWCVVEEGGKFAVPIFVEFKSNTPFVPTGYILTTGGDTEDYSGRNPKNWVIKARNEGDTEWTTLETMTNDTTLGAKNNESYEFSFSTPNDDAYQYYRFEVDAIKKGGVFQLSEFEFVGHPADPEDLKVSKIEGLASKYITGTTIASLNYTVKTYEGQTVDSQYYDVTFEKDGVPVSEISEDGNYTMTITGKDGYRGSHAQSFVVGPMAVTSINGLEPKYFLNTPVNSLGYTVKDEFGQTIDPDYYDVAFKKDGAKVTDFSVTGKYTMTVTGKDIYYGSVSASFDVGYKIVYSGFTPTAGTKDDDDFIKSINPNEDYDKLVDGIKDVASNKWCVAQAQNTFYRDVYCDFNSSEPFVPTGYILTTGGDVETYPLRNPNSWRIYGKNEGDTDWTSLDEVDYAGYCPLEAKNNKSYEFSFLRPNNKAYQYYIGTSNL